VVVVALVGFGERGKGGSRDGWGKAPWRGLETGGARVGLFCNLSPCLFYFISFFSHPFLKALQHFILYIEDRERERSG
jgi:hypothetical protein